MNRSLHVVAWLLPLLLAGCFGAPYRASAPVVERSPGSSQSSTRPQAQAAPANSGVQVTPLDNPESRVRVAPLGSPESREQTAPQGSTEPREQLASYEAPAAVASPPTTSSAVAGLLAKADEQQWTGDTAGSAATVERALRIEPGNAYLWSRLAQLRHELHQYAQAEDLAAKSNSLAGADQRLRRDNWLLIARARQAAGDRDGARRAEQEAETLR